MSHSTQVSAYPQGGVYKTLGPVGVFYHLCRVTVVYVCMYHVCMYDISGVCGHGLYVWRPREQSTTISLGRAGVWSHSDAQISTTRSQPRADQV